MLNVSCNISEKQMSHQLDPEVPITMCQYTYVSDVFQVVVSKLKERVRGHVLMIQNVKQVTCYEPQLRRIRLY